MGSKERFSPGADGLADGARLGLTSVWEGSVEPAPPGPYGHVHLPPVDSFDLPGAVEALVLVNELQSWVEAQKAKLVERIREHYGGEARSWHDDETVAEEESSSLAAEEIGASLRLPVRTAPKLHRYARAVPRPGAGWSLSRTRTGWRG